MFSGVKIADDGESGWGMGRVVVVGGRGATGPLIPDVETRME